MKHLLSFLLLHMLFISPNKAFCNDLEEDSIAIKIDTLLKRFDKPNTPGLTIAIIDNGKLVFNKGYGLANIEKKIPNNSNVAYKIASVSKQFTAAAMLKLVKEKEISLNDTIQKYIPEFPDYGSPITIADLLYHTSGIRDNMVLMWLCGLSFEDNFTNQDALKIILKQKQLNFIPKKRCVYSNSNYILLAEVIKRVSGMSFEKYVKQHIFNPLAMHESGVGKPAKQTMAVSYAMHENTYKPFKNNNTTFGDGGFFTTIADLQKWDALFYDQGTLNHQLLTTGTLDNGNRLTYGMGIMMGQYRNNPIQMHPGAFLGYRAEILRFPQKKITIICLGNSEAINPETITRQIADIYIFGDDLVHENVVTLNHDLASIKDIIGKYEIAPNVMVDIKFEDNILFGKATGQPEQYLYPIAKNTYSIGSTGDTLVFKEKEGVVNQLVIVQKNGNTVAQKLEWVTKELEGYTGKYLNEEQNAIYTFFIEADQLWFQVGKNPKTKAEVLKKYDRLHFSYKNLEHATIDFMRNESGSIIGFTLNTGRITGLKFKKQQ